MLIEQGIHVKKIKLSRIREVMNYCKALEKRGKVILDFTNGQPDFDTPTYIKSAAIKALNDGKTGYASIVGVEELRQAISEHVYAFGIIVPELFCAEIVDEVISQEKLMIEQAKKEARKEFAEKLKDKFYFPDIDKLLKEYEEMK